MLKGLFITDWALQPWYCLGHECILQKESQAFFRLMLAKTQIFFTCFRVTQSMVPYSLVMILLSAGSVCGRNFHLDQAWAHCFSSINWLEIQYVYANNVCGRSEDIWSGIISKTVTISISLFLNQCKPAEWICPRFSCSIYAGHLQNIYDLQVSELLIIFSCEATGVWVTIIQFVNCCGLIQQAQHRRLLTSLPAP